MAKDKYGGHTPKVESTVRTGRKQLMDITNTGVRLSASLKDACGDALSTPLSKGCTAHLLKEVGLLQKRLLEKEAIIESKNLEMKRIWINWVQLSEQNKQLTKRNSKISKELAFDQEQLKLVQHEYKQMSAMFKAKIAELEEKSNDLSHLLRDMQEREGKNSSKIQHEQELQSKFTSTRKTEDSYTTSGNLSNETDGSSIINESASEENSCKRKSCLRRRPDKISYKEPSLKEKLRKNSQCEWLDKTSSESNCQGASLDGQDNLEKVCENDVLHFSKVPRSMRVIQDPSASGELRDPRESIKSCESLEDAYFSSMKMSALRGNAARVKIEQHQDEEQEGCAPLNSSLNAALSLESTHPLRSMAGRPLRKAAEIVVSYKEIPLNIKLRRSA